MKHDRFLRTHPVFRSDELGAHLAAQGEVGPRTRESLLTYYRRAGRILVLRRGLYAVVPPGADPDSFPVDPFLVAARATTDAVLAYHTALQFHGRAYSFGNQFTYGSANPVRPFEYQTHVYRGVKSHASLRRATKEDLGVMLAERSGLDVRVTTLERTFVDVLSRPDLSGGWEEIWRSLESIEYFDIDQVLEYVRLLGNATTAAKAGFFLEQHREELMVTDDQLNVLRAQSPKQPTYLERGSEATGRFLAGWNLVVPQEILDRSWSEPA
ncbi:MAG: transcriptional regulator [Candidatus Latescibacteria bacterium]|nr:transcriptional regulator [Candidatus Latescibacterota bacterium]